MLMHKSGHVDDRLIDYLNVIGNEKEQNSTRSQLRDLILLNET